MTARPARRRHSPALGALLLLAACGGEEPRPGGPGDPLHELPFPLPPPERGLPPSPIAHVEPVEAFPVPPLPFSDGMWPCSDCHDPGDGDPTPRRLKEKHQKLRFDHDEENRWCLDCHALEDRDKLHLAGGKLVGFQESYRVCGQCHGEKLRDWKVGVHGKRTGRWDGEKEYLLCAHCHDPHAPKFKPLAPKPPPVRPTDVK